MADIELRDDDPIYVSQDVMISLSRGIKSYQEFFEVTKKIQEEYDQILEFEKKLPFKINEFFYYKSKSAPDCKIVKVDDIRIYKERNEARVYASISFFPCDDEYHGTVLHEEDFKYCRSIKKQDLVELLVHSNERYRNMAREIYRQQFGESL